MDFDEYLVAGRAGGWSPATQAQYGWHLARFGAWLAEQGCYQPDGLTRALLRGYGAALADVYSPATRRVSAIAIRSWLRWMAEEGLLPGGTDLATAIKAPRVPRQAQRTAMPDEVEAMLAACDEPVRGLSEEADAAVRCRNAAMIALLYDGMLRASELCRLTLTDLEIARLRCLVRGKGGKREFVRFGPETAERLQGWLQVRPGVVKAGEEALFVAVGGNTPGCQLTSSGLRVIIRRLGERAGVAPISPHAFRRGSVVAQLMAGASSRYVQINGRWDNIAEVERYSQQLNAAAAYDQFSPMTRLVNTSFNGRPVNSDLTVER